MKTIITVIVCFCMISTCVWGAESVEEKYWPTWRGPVTTGVAPLGNPPINWSEDQNIRWKIEIPGKGLASPIVWRNTVFVLTAIETDKQVEPQEKSEPQRRGRRGPPNIKTTIIHKFVIFAINRQDGSILWQRTVREELPHEGTHPTGSWASNSPVTDGEHVYAYFGSRGLYCFDMQGNLQWEKDLGEMTIKLGFGEGSSPVLYGEVIVINWDHEGQSFIAALDKNTGKEVWKVDRDERTSWSTPIVVGHDGKPQVIISATDRTRSYELTTGNLIWECRGMTLNAIPTPVAANGMVYLTSGFRGNALQAIRLASAKGDITDSEAIVWEYDRDTPYVPSPLLYGNRLYFLKRNNGILSCFNAETGEAHYGPQRLEGIDEVYASPVGASHRVYLVGRNGTAVVVKDGPTFEVLAENVLDDSFDASPAIVDREIYLRGHKYLYCIASD
ncbi:PQQ-binding-like beta-propeller repeat protein [Candidatus Poribacteria bacterium]|nr:PQQ-binding-like beta-propeller repeat protein [Candidatus Poribacteria bacterium]